MAVDSTSLVERLGPSAIGLPPSHRLGALLHFVRRKPLGAAGGALIALMLLVAAAAPLAPRSPFAQSGLDRLKAPSASHWFGTDEAGRDIFSRVVWGARTSLEVGIVAVLVGTATGSIIGLVSGYFGAAVDMVFQRMMDAVLAFPGLVLAMVIAAMFRPSIALIMLAIAIVLVPGTNRVVRSAVLAVKPNPFIEAARVLGASDLRIIARHILPNVTSPILILATATLGNAILVEAALSFVGLGTPPPAPSWGQMLSGSGRLYFETAPWMAVAPGAAITLAVLGFNLFGDALRDVWDPRLRGTG